MIKLTEDFSPTNGCEKGAYLLIQHRLEKLNAPSGDYTCINLPTTVQGTADYEGLNPQWSEEVLQKFLVFQNKDTLEKFYVSSTLITCSAYGADYPDHESDGVYSNYGVTYKFNTSHPMWLFVASVLQKFDVRVGDSERRFYTTRDGLIIDVGIWGHELYSKALQHYGKSNVEFHEDDAIEIWENVVHDEQFSYKAVLYKNLVDGSTLYELDESCMRMEVSALKGTREVVGRMQLSHLLS